MMNALESLRTDDCSRQLGAVVIGMQPVVRALAIAIVARGHVLLQGAPGLGKTLLSKTLAAALGGEFKRVQGTSDLMPADITGVHVFDPETREFVFRPGPVFADVLLVDEINRAGPKTQSALLEAMEERQVTVDRQNYPLPREFPRHRDAESARVRGHVSLARVAARSLHAAHRSRLSGARDELAVLDRYGNVDAHAATPARQRDRASKRSLRLARAVEKVHVAPELSGYIARSRRGVACARSCESRACRRAARWRCCALRASPPACAARRSSRPTT